MNRTYDTARRGRAGRKGLVGRHMRSGGHQQRGSEYTKAHVALLAELFGKGRDDERR